MRTEAGCCEVYLAADPINAEIVKDLLVEHGYAAYVRRAYLWGGVGELPANVYPSVWVPEHETEAARQVVADFEADRLSKAADWTCPGCGEPIDGVFAACWRCQHVRPQG
ncbi:DUF2007 domain-containing protein [uncultured Salinisphaera sp.]|uniref:putative signal transducing protein n=1 Tax=uncultured Salinisphaera sp. TaxID=359372 RepID=UPI0032B1C551|tara:strand:+ start:15527 stop:15856 length:330 start_codon:yes stop_codon:yes gene_type:complete